MTKVETTKKAAEDAADHPAAVADSRAAATDDQNRIDFNDPTLSGAEAVAKNLAESKKKAD